MKTGDVNGADLGARIRALRLEKGLSQRELGEPAASASYLSLIESGARRPSRKLLDHLAARLEVEPEELLTGRSRSVKVRLELELQEARLRLRLGNEDDAAGPVHRVAEQAHELGLNRLEAKCYEELASVEEQRNLLEPALDLYRRAESLWADEPSHLRFQTVAGIARCTQGLGDPRLAIHMLESYLLELEREGVPDPAATMRIHSALVICYSTLGLASKAAEAAQKAQSLAPRVSDAEELACMNMNVARSLFEQGQMSDALDAIRTAEQAYLSLGWEINVARARLNTAIVQMEKGDLDEARMNLTESLEVLKSRNNSSEAAKALDELGRLERMAGDLSKGESLLLEAQDFLGDGDISERALNLRELGLCIQERDRDSATRHFLRAIELYLLAGASLEVVSTYKLLGDLHQRHGELELSAHAYRAGIEAVETRANA